MRRLALLAVLVAVFSGLAAPARKKKPEKEVTQTLELPKELPNAVTAETQRLVFHVSPLSAKGLLSQQVRDALRALLRLPGNPMIVKLRAFAAGSGDVRRIQTIVSETFTEKRLPLPALTVVQGGGLPLTGAQVVIESVGVARKAVNPNGLAFLPGQAEFSETPLGPVARLAEASMATLRRDLAAAGLGSQDVVRMTCFLGALEDAGAVRQLAGMTFPDAALNLVQLQRAPSRGYAQCEAVARLRSPLGEPLRRLSAPPAPGSAGVERPRAVLVGAARVALTGAQLAFGYQESDARLAFERLDKALDQAGGASMNAAAATVYPLSSSIGMLAGKVMAGLYEQAGPPAGAMLPVEGLPSLDAAFAVDAVAVLPNAQ